MKRNQALLGGLLLLCGGVLLAANAPDMRLANGKLLIGNSSGVAAPVTPSGDVTISNTGVTTLGTGVIVAADLAANSVTPTKLAPTYSIAFTEGASKGLAILAATGLAYSTTADAHNDIYYGGQQLKFVTITTATGTFTPAADAEGLDLTVGGGDNDALDIYGGAEGAAGRAFIIGTDPAFKFCATWKVFDVTGTDHMYCGFRTIQAPDDPISQYTDYCAIGHISGNYGTQDKTTGATDSGADTIADNDTDEWCTSVSAAGLCSYTIDGVAAESVDTHTLGDGIPVVPFCTLRNSADLADDTWLTSWVVTLQ